MVCLDDSLRKVSLIEDRQRTVGTIRQSHPMEGGTVILLRFLDEIVSKLDDIVMTHVVVCLTIVGSSPFSDDDRGTLGDKVGVKGIEHIIQLCLHAADVFYVGVGMNLYGNMSCAGGGIRGNLHPF